jgi:hypothetical protein
MLSVVVDPTYFSQLTISTVLQRKVTMSFSPLPPPSSALWVLCCQGSFTKKRLELQK